MAALRSTSSVFAALLSVAAFTALPACSTDQDGVKSTYRSQYTTVSQGVEEVTEAAEEVLSDLKLKDVTSSATAVDGQATGKTADDTVITVSVAKVAAGSEVTVNVGTLGDPELGKSILADLDKKLAD